MRVYQFRHARSGRVLCTATLAGKDNSTSLDTDILSVAKNRPDRRLDNVTGGDMENWNRGHAKKYAASRTNGGLVLWRFVFARAVKAVHVAEDLRLHDLRHIFTTRCLESGVHLPTVSRWLGHKDGGGLAARIYDHLTDDHSAAQAGRVKA